MTHIVGRAATGLPETTRPRDVDLLHVSILLNQALIIIRKALVHADAEAARATLAKGEGR
jgi:hypothetical protein